MAFLGIYGDDRDGNSLAQKPGSRADYVTSIVRDSQSDPGANRPELQKLQNSLSSLKASDPATYLKLDAALKQNGNDDKFTDMASERPDLVNKHMSEITKDPSRLNTILNTIEQESKTSAKPSVSMNEQKAAPVSANHAVAQAADTLAQSGNRQAAQELASKADQIPPGVATTAANAINGNPDAARKTMESSVSPLNTTMKFAGMASMFSRIQNILPMLTNMLGGMGDRVMGALGNSGGLAAMGNMDGNPLAKAFTEMGGVNASNTKMLSVDPNTGLTGTFGTPPFAPPAASQLQQNALAAVPGMSAPSPTMG